MSKKHFKENGSTRRKKIRLKRKSSDNDPWWDCFDLLKMLKKEKKIWPFKHPVDPKKLNIPEYYETISLPMDLKTIEKKLINNSYTNMSDFANDVRLIWSNAETFNGPDNDVTLLARNFRELFEKKLEEKQNAIRERYNRLAYTKRRLKRRPYYIRKAFKHITIKSKKSDSQKTMEPKVQVPSEPIPSIIEQNQPVISPSEGSTLNPQPMDITQQPSSSELIQQSHSVPLENQPIQNISKHF